MLYSVDKDDPSQPDKVAYVFDKDVKAAAGIFSGADYLSSLESSDEGITFQIRGTEKIKADNYFLYYFTDVYKRQILLGPLYDSIGEP